MPKQTFFKLNKEKQEKIITSAIKEFSRVDYDSASINKIIQLSEISRGSFYLYFSDKEDLYFYIINLDKKRLFDRIAYLLKRENGNFLNIFEDLFIDIINYCKNNNYFDFHKKVFLNMRIISEQKYLLKPNELEKDEILKSLYSNINSNLYNNHSKEEILETFKFMMMIMIHSITHYFLNESDLEEITKKYNYKIKLIKNGFNERNN